MKNSLLVLGLAASAAMASLATAQPGGPGAGYGPGAGSGYGPGYGHGAGYGPGCGAGMGSGPGGAFALLMPDERLLYRDRMHAASTVDQCRAIVAEHRQLIEARARDKGVTPPPGPNASMCDRMKERGYLD